MKAETSLLFGIAGSGGISNSFSFFLGIIITISCAIDGENLFTSWVAIPEIPNFNFNLLTAA